MTCAPQPPTFRLLDAYVGWEVTGPPGDTGLTGFDDPAGVRLAYAGNSPAGPTRRHLLPWFPDRRLAPGCRPGAWYLAVPGGPRLLRRDACGWTPVWRGDRDPGLARHPVSVAARGHRVALVERDRVLVWRREGEQLAGVVKVRGARRAALAPGDEVLVAREDGTDLWRFASDGRPRGVLRTGIPGEIAGLLAGPGRAIWVLADDGSPRIYRGGRHRPFEPATLEELAAAVPPSGLVSAGEDGFRLTENGADGETTRCYTWRGRPRPGDPPEPEAYVPAGQYVTARIDSGLSRCRWHRVRVDADVPPGTAVGVEIVVSEDDRYAESDWQAAPPGTTDFLVDQPPGRFLTLRLRLSGDGAATPVVRRIRLDFPRATSADLLPPAFRQDPAADDFTERFLSLFDASLEELDRVIERHPALLDPAGVPDRALPWLAGLLGLSFEAGWDARTRRALLAAAPELYRRRGTPWALKKAVRIVFGVKPVLDELTGDRQWAQVRRLASGSGPGLGAVRLFGRSSSRFRVGGSALGGAPLRAFGDPDGDPQAAHAHRFRVLLPAGSADERALGRLVERQAPAHTAGSVRLGGAGFVVGARSTVGVDTAFVPLPPPVLGGALRLNRDGVLRPGPKGAHAGVSAGVISAVGVHTQLS
ncbi:hypothetical protein Ssi03_22370 [Sphaerisporangium siamense]|uniref:Phage tail-like protein n=1 Tax=Sphaerisporangium siamense TaxID=795645 RepID=A0A7W7GAJ7_9ACTN|nr:phage tail protein [Sphaerisporangium siamense]MBB4701845.1 phage tail-like protein [Sphaerisporangium siamense]GII84247.1 hypothetical protein Ssi03_22370 [Sphaerisporangium siamense]